MKYIRTKDGRILKEANCAEFSPEYYSDYMQCKLRESDSIGELCDEYVLESKGRSYRTLLMKTGAYDDKISLFGGFVKDIKNGWISCCLHYLQGGRTIYGAIWTDEGLKYVAKMNVKGEFELL